MMISGYLCYRDVLGAFPKEEGIKDLSYNSPCATNSPKTLPLHILGFHVGFPVQPRYGNLCVMY